MQITATGNRKVPHFSGKRELPAELIRPETGRSILLNVSPLSVPSPQFQTLADKLIKGLPVYIQSLMLKSGAFYAAGRLLTEMYPGLASQNAPGHEGSVIWDFLEGGHGGNCVSVAEMCYNPVDTAPVTQQAATYYEPIPAPDDREPVVPFQKKSFGLIEAVLSKVTPKRIREVLGHETGHNLRAVLDPDNTYNDAIMKDYKAMSESQAFFQFLDDPKLNIYLHYLIQPNEKTAPTEGGKDEAFAEGFRYLIAPQKDYYSEVFNQFFKNAKSRQQELLKQAEAEYQENLKK